MHLDNVAFDRNMLLFNTCLTRKKWKKVLYSDARWLQQPEIENVVKIAWKKQQ